MSMLARYKKGGGIIELVKLVEDSPEPKRTQLLDMIRREDPDFAVRVEARLFGYENLKTLEENLLAEIISSSAAKFVAMAMVNEPDANFIKLVEKCIGKNFQEYKAEKELFVSTPPSPGQIDAARKKLVAEARKLESDGKIKLPFTEPPEAPQGTGANAAHGGALGEGATGPVGTASGDAACPAIETFGVEAPPPGLTGERLEQFFKNQLGI